MMNRLFNIIKSVIISVESIIVVFVMSLWLLDKELFFIKISKLFFGSFDIEHIMFQFAIPLTMISISYKQRNSFLQPDIDLRYFYKWKDYNKLKDTLISAFIWNSFCILITGTILIYNNVFSNKLIGALYVSFCFASIYSTTSLIFARQRIKEIIEINK